MINNNNDYYNDTNNNIRDWIKDNYLIVGRQNDDN